VYLQRGRIVGLMRPLVYTLQVAGAVTLPKTQPYDTAAKRKGGRMAGWSLDNIGLVTEDLGASLDFYTQLLGFELVDHDVEFGSAAINIGSARLFLLQGRGGSGPRRGSDPAANPSGLDHLSLATPDVDETFAVLRERGVEFFAPPQDADWGARFCGCRDPGGLPIYFLRWSS
jgi:catechol 2,3-dioxygenase-like lactoylglutathione lyase family enzyme